MAALEKVQALIDRYALAAHPEGGYFREVYRSQRKVTRNREELLSANRHLLSVTARQLQCIS